MRAPLQTAHEGRTPWAKLTTYQRVVGACALGAGVGGGRGRGALLPSRAQEKARAARKHVGTCLARVATCVEEHSGKWIQHCASR